MSEMINIKAQKKVIVIFGIRRRTAPEHPLATLACLGLFLRSEGTMIRRKLKLSPIFAN